MLTLAVLTGWQPCDADDNPSLTELTRCKGDNPALQIASFTELARPFRRRRRPLCPRPLQNLFANVPAKIRLDKWLWAARFYKTRAIAKQSIEGGKVHCNGARSKPSKEITLGTRIASAGL